LQYYCSTYIQIWCKEGGSGQGKRNKSNSVNNQQLKGSLNFNSLQQNQKILMKKTTLFFLAVTLIAFLFNSCKQESHKKNISSVEQIVDPNKKWSERFALSEIYRFPDPTKLDFQEKPRWSYTNGLVLQAMSQEYERSNNQKIYDYIYDYANRMVNEDGSINTYKLKNYNLDMIKSGDVMFYLYNKTKEKRFLMAMDTLHKQLEGQPTTSEGGYWHKKRYPFQMWLDGVYMAEPFHAKYITNYIYGKEKEAALDKLVLQFDLIEKYSRDAETGLYYHGWDESREQRWAHKETGLSPHFWSRGMGWYGMAMVDIIEILPEDHPGKERIKSYLNRFVEAIIKYQDKSGTWYQVIDLPKRAGNYKEATSTCMFTYTLAKAAKNGYIPKEYLSYAEKAYTGIHSEFITIEENGLVNLNKCCSVAGLGGDPYRDGSFEYYIGEKIRSNDPKGTGPFIMASLILDK
jgi:unsaturated rhamnogalacturonyl hydrolase